MPTRLLRFVPRLSLTLLFASTLFADSKPPLRVAIAGLVHGHADGFFSHSLNRSDIQIVAIAEPDRSLFDHYAAKFHLDPALYHADLDEALRSTHPQAVLGYTSTYDHRKVIELCAHYAIPVMVEKPLAVSYEDAQVIATVARSAKILVLVNYETSWYPSNHAAYKLLHDGAIGELRKVVVHDGHEGPQEIHVGPEFFKWLTDPKLNGGGALFDFGCYGADLMTFLMDGQRPLTVTAVTQQIKPDIYPRVDDEATIMLTYQRAQAILQASWNWPYSRKDMEVYGRTGSVSTIAAKDISVRLPNEPQSNTRTAPPIPAPYDDSLTYLRAVLLDGAKPDALSSLETNLIVVEILDAARRSASTGQTIHLPQ
jgi:scyllo-inositol 2-dehydrogenase (NADP+)